MNNLFMGKLANKMKFQALLSNNVACVEIFHLNAFDISRRFTLKLKVIIPKSN